MTRSVWRRRRRQYILSFLFFTLLYGSIIAAHGTLPATFILAVLAVALGKDLVDEWRMWHGGEALAYRHIEHNPSNVVLLLVFATGLVALPGATLGVPDRLLVPVLAVLDLMIDGSQDLRATGTL